MSDIERFKRMGIHDGKMFFVSGLRGIYRLDAENKTIKAYDVTTTGKINYCGVVKGLYESLLAGRCKVEKKKKGTIK